MVKLETGRAEVTDRKLLVSGLTRDEEVHDGLPKLVRAAANRACKEELKIEALNKASTKNSNGRKRERKEVVEFYLVIT